MSDSVVTGLANHGVDYQQNFKDGDVQVDADGDSEAKTLIKPPEKKRTRHEDGASGANLFVTGLHPSLSGEDVTHMFELFGEVESCSIMVDPRKKSPGFGFVEMLHTLQADAPIGASRRKGEGPYSQHREGRL